MATNFTFTGFDNMEKKLASIARRTPKAAATALRLEAEEIMTASKREYVPVDLGTLRNSGRVEEPKIVGDEITVGMTYGGAAAAYALAIHEHLSEHSPPSWQGKSITEILSVRDRIAWSATGKGPKYLERPLNKAKRGMAKRIAETIEAMS